jgi:ABC-type molybdate transport system substrate-binding protein
MYAWSRFAAITMAGCLSALIAGTANAAEITVVAGGGPLPDVMGTLVPMFESATGNKVKISFKGGPAITADVKQGAADLVITSPVPAADAAPVPPARKRNSKSR